MNSEIHAMSFSDLMSQYDVKIPKIQRNYAQGRNNGEGKELRKNFVPALVKVASSMTDSMLLDFVYGELRERDEKRVLVLLDGQQRLTTLFLLHWLCGKTNTDWSFDYESRRKAQFFVKGLLSNKPPKNEQSISAYLKSQDWFILSWQIDETVKGMLIMLDALYAEMQGKNIDLIKLDNIKFYLKGLDKIASDQVYLKMNARGRVLTEWENLKAILDEEAQCLGQEESDKWKYEIANEYTEYIWRFASMGNVNSDTNMPIESKIENLNFGFINIFYSALYDVAILQKNISPELTNLLHDHNITLSGIVDLLTQLNADKYKVFEQANKYLKALNNIEFFQTCWTDERNQNALWNSKQQIMSNKFCKEFLFNKSNISYKHKLRFAIFAEWLVTDKEEWKLRALLNLLDNTNVEKDNYPRILKDIHCLVVKLSSQWLSCNRDGFDSEQFDEEQKKITLRNGDHSWNNLIVIAEHLPFFEGRITALLNSAYSNNIYDINYFKNILAFCCSSDFLPEPIGNKKKLWNDFYKSYITWTSNVDLPIYCDYKYKNVKLIFDRAKPGICNYLKEQKENTKDLNDWVKRLYENWDLLNPIERCCDIMIYNRNGWLNTDVFLYLNDNIITNAILLSDNIRYDVIPFINEIFNSGIKISPFPQGNDLGGYWFKIPDEYLKTHIPSLFAYGISIGFMRNNIVLRNNKSADRVEVRLTNINDVNINKLDYIQESLFSTLSNLSSKIQPTSTIL